MRLQPTHQFVREVKRLSKKHPSLRADLNQLQNQLLNNPYEGKSLGQSCYKIRMAITSKGQGKSGGARVVTCIRIERDTIYLLKIFDKSEQETISDAELTELLQQIED